MITPFHFFNYTTLPDKNKLGIILSKKLSFSGLGSMFGSLKEATFTGFRGVSSFSDMDDSLMSAFNKQFKVGADNISEYTMSQIQAKAAVLGLSDELTTQAMAMANDADFITKSRAQRLTWGKALKDNTVDIRELDKAYRKFNPDIDVLQTDILDLI